MSAKHRWFGLMCIGCLLLFLSSVSRADQTEPKTVRQVTTISLPGHLSDNRFADYLTLEGETLYVGFTSEDTLVLIDTDNSQVIATVPGLPRVRTIAIYPDRNLGFTSNGGDNTIGVIDLASRDLVRSLSGGDGPAAILYDKKARLIYVADRRGKTALLIDPETQKMVAIVPLGGVGEFAQADPKTGFVYQNLEDTNEVVVVDPKQQKVVKRFSTAPGAGPTGLALDPIHHRLFCACGDKQLVVLNADTGSVVATLPIGGAADVVAYDAKLRRIYTANGAGTMTVIYQETPDRYTVLEDVPTHPGGHALALDPTTHRLYVVYGAEIAIFDAVPPQKP